MATTPYTLVYQIYLVLFCIWLWRDWNWEINFCSCFSMVALALMVFNIRWYGGRLLWPSCICSSSDAPWSDLGWRWHCGTPILKNFLMFIWYQGEQHGSCTWSYTKFIRLGCVFTCANMIFKGAPFVEDDGCKVDCLAFREFSVSCNHIIDQISNSIKNNIDWLTGIVDYKFCVCSSSSRFCGIILT